MEGNQHAGVSLAQCREQIAAARSAVSALGSVLWQAPSGGGAAGLAGLLGEVDDLGLACDAARVAVVGEALDRGETSGGSAAMTATQWVRHHAPSTRAGGAGTVVAVAQAFQKQVNAPVKEAVDAGRLPVASAAVVVSEADKLRPMLGDLMQEPALSTLIETAADDGPRAAGGSAPFILARYGAEGVLQDQQDRGKAFIALSQPRDTGADTFEYRLTLDVEGKAVLEAALGPLSAPKPVDGERDLRTLATGAAATPCSPWSAGPWRPGTRSARPTRPPCCSPWTGSPCATGSAPPPPSVGSTPAPTSPPRPCDGCAATPRSSRSCSAATVRSSTGAWSERFFTAAQTRRLWLRDGGCTYPGCDAPPQWTDAHHLVHWADFGPSDLDNGALLCDRHHTIVHNRRYAGRVVRGALGERVEWDLTRGSYDQLLARRAAQEPA